MRRAAAAAVAAAALAAGCAAGPDFVRPAPPAGSEFLPGGTPGATLAPAGGDPQRFVADRPPPADWWHLYASPELDALVAEALAANPGVAAAAATLRAARESYLAERGSLLPEVDVGASASRSRDAVSVVSPTLASGAPLYDLYGAALAVSYPLDLAGGQRRAVESQAALAEEARCQLAATYLTVAGNVVAAAIQAAGLAAALEAAERQAALEQRTLATLRRQHALGAAAGLDVSGEEAALAALDAALPPLRRQYAATLHLLAVLTGRLPAAPALAVPRLEALALPPELPLGLPAQLVERRPDVCAAAADLHAATAADGVAAASLMPVISLSGTVGSTATAWRALLGAGTGYWSLGASLSETLFAGGAHLHRKRAADAAMDASGAAYRATVLAAFESVADALRAVETDAAALDAAARAAGAAARSTALVRRQVELGAASPLALLAAERSEQAAQAGLAAVRAGRLADTAALFVALGGPVTAPR